MRFVTFRAGSSSSLYGAGRTACPGRSGTHGTDGVVLVRDRRAEDGHQAVAEELVKPAFVGVDLGEERLLHLLDDREDLLGVELFGQGREADDVREEDGYIAALAFKLLAGAQDFVNQVTRDARLQPLEGSARWSWGQCRRRQGWYRNCRRT